MEWLPLILPLAALSLVAAAVRTTRAGRQWLERSGGERQKTDVGSGFAFAGQRRVVITPLFVPALSPRVVVDVVAEVDARSLRKKLRDGRVREALDKLRALARPDRPLVIPGSVRIPLTLPPSAPHVSLIAEHAVALAVAIEAAGLVVDGEGPSTGSPIAVRALDAGGERRT